MLLLTSDRKSVDQTKKNLIKEGKCESDIYVTGNTAIDTLKTTVKSNYTNEIIDKIGNDRIILLTAHRRENLGDTMKNMFLAIKKIVEEFNDVQVVYPVHLNPKVRDVADEILGDNKRWTTFLLRMSNGLSLRNIFRTIS